jgi:hypothetical protein
LFLLARALQPALPALKGELKTLSRILPRLGECSHHHCGTEGPSKDLDRVWNEFFNNSDISKLPAKPLEILQAARAASLKLAGAEPDCIADLSGAHERGYILVESMLKTNGLSSLCPSPTSLLVSYDHEAKSYCASTNRIADRVCWTHQPVPHSLYGALIAELIIAHEYLSHIVPRNPRLGPSFTEIWLVFALIEWFQEKGPQQDVGWKTQVWYLMREELKKHLEKMKLAESTPARVYREEGHYGAYDFAVLLYGRSKIAFWKLTGEILKLPNDKEKTDLLMSLLDQMTGDHAAWLNRLSRTKWLKIDDLT